MSRSVTTRRLRSGCTRPRYGRLEAWSSSIDVDDDDVLDVAVVLVVEVEEVEPSVVSVLDDELVDAVVVVEATVVATVVGVVVGVVVAFCVSVVDSTGKSDGRPGWIGSLASGERTLGPICGPDGGGAVVVGDSITSLTSASWPPRSESTVIALNANGAATANTVTVESDSASRNRLPPDVSSGRCRYMANQVGMEGAAELLTVFYPNSSIDVGLRDK